MPQPLSKRIIDVLALDPDAAVIQYEGRWFSWAQLGGLVYRIGALTSQHANSRAGILLRNSPTHVGALLGVLSVGGTVVVVNPSRGDDRTRADLSALQLPLVIGSAGDLANLLNPASSTTVVTISERGQPRRSTSLPTHPRPGRAGPASPCRC
jgi:acyl-CoA synthetase (AMP-forming)/AMP-acid ligase II